MTFNYIGDYCRELADELWNSFPYTWRDLFDPPKTITAETIERDIELADRAHWNKVTEMAERWLINGVHPSSQLQRRLRPNPRAVLLKRLLLLRYRLEFAADRLLYLDGGRHGIGIPEDAKLDQMALWSVTTFWHAAAGLKIRAVASNLYLDLLHPEHIPGSDRRD